MAVKAYTGKRLDDFVDYYAWWDRHQRPKWFTIADFDPESDLAVLGRIQSQSPFTDCPAIPGRIERVTESDEEVKEYAVKREWDKTWRYKVRRARVDRIRMEAFNAFVSSCGCVPSNKCNWCGERKKTRRHGSIPGPMQYHRSLILCEDCRRLWSLQEDWINSTSLDPPPRSLK